MKKDIRLIFNRIKLAFDIKTDAELAKFLDITPQTLSNCVIRNTVNWDNLLSKCESININWLLSGSGSLLKNANTLNVDDDTIKNEVPLYEAGAAAGSGSFSEMLHESIIVDYYKVPEFQNADFLIYIVGSSMMPKYANRDIVACKIIEDPQFLQWGRPHVIGTKDQGLLCKRIYPSEQENHIHLVSENSIYEPFDVPQCDIVGIALVLGVIHCE